MLLSVMVIIAVSASWTSGIAQAPTTIGVARMMSLRPLFLRQIIVPVTCNVYLKVGNSYPVANE